LLAAVVLLPCLGACSSGPALPQCAVSPTAASDGYQLGSGDRLQVTVFRHDSLSGEFALDATGTIALPLVGAVPADGLTTRQLESAIEDQLREGGYLVAPDVSIALLNRRPFYVLGEVAQPGQYEHVAGMTLAKAVAVAGGYTYRADRGSVTISRGHCLREATAATRVLPGEIIRVPARFF
jgi:protein involved in polysaccharide export with SLBB domain